MGAGAILPDVQTQSPKELYRFTDVAPHHFRHFDELLEDMGAGTRRRSAPVEKFAPPDADAYARFLASAPGYTVAPPEAN